MLVLNPCVEKYRDDGPGIECQNHDDAMADEQSPARAVFGAAGPRLQGRDDAPEDLVFAGAEFDEPADEVWIHSNPGPFAKFEDVNLLVWGHLDSSRECLVCHAAFGGWRKR